MGRALSPQEAQQPRRGDLMFWKGHVAIVRDEATLLHANAHHMATAIEGIHDAVARIESAGSSTFAPFNIAHHGVSFASGWTAA